MKFIIHTDGGARGNPGPSSSAFVVTNADGALIHQDAFYLGVATNNVAEYMAVLRALEYLKTEQEKFESVEFYLDSNLVVQQLNKQFKIKNAQLKEFADQIFSLLAVLPPVTFSYVPREENREADKLVNECLDNVVV